MKTKTLKSGILMVLFCISLAAQQKPSIAITSIDTKGLYYDNQTLASLVRLELEKTNVFEVKDKYDVAYKIEEKNIDVDKSFGKNRQIELGKILETDKMLTGSAEKFGEKIILILRLIDVKQKIVEKASVVEYISQEDEIQHMVRISLAKLLDLPIETNIENLLVDYERPITSPKTRVKLNGPRMGATIVFGDNANIITAPEVDGGFNSYPVASMFGYQHEIQYLSSGDFQALIEFIGAINGLETGKFVPSLTFLNGFRFNKGGWEIGIGPTFRAVRMAEGYYGEDGKWNISQEPSPYEYYNPETANEEIVEEPPRDYTLRLDSRGDIRLSTGLIVAIGKTFRSGYLNIPVNLYVSPRKEGTVVGLTFGFNVARSKKM